MASIFPKHYVQVETFVAPTTETLDAVHEWLSDNGVTADTTSSAGDWLMVSMPVDKANVMFDANFSVFSHESSGQQSIRTLSYSIPTDLKAHLEVLNRFTPPSAKLPLKVTPRGVAAPTAPKNRSTSGDPAGDCPDTYIDTGCLAALYNIPRTPATEPSNYIVVTGFDDEYANQGDLQTFLYWNRPCMSDTTTFTVEELDGGGNDQDPSDAGYEAVRIFYSVIFLSVGENSTDGVFGFLDVANDILNNDTLPSVITTSYGSNEEYISFNVANSLCNAYAQLGARGVSVLFSSGDGGVSGTQSESCTDFVPSFPSGCPYVTSVGATQSYEPEVAADFSSGGFSNYWATPSFQASAVSSYLSYLGSTNAGLFNASGRGFPDVSAQGVTFRIAYDGYWVDLDGTSCSSPTFASVIAVLNDQLVANGKPTLGWLNPFLYSTGASAMNDITSGDNPGCNTNGFSATTGWDPVTGLGTPNYDLLLSAAGL